jgi:hypothetical protein
LAGPVTRVSGTEPHRVAHGAVVTRERPSCRTPIATRWTFGWSGGCGACGRLSAARGPRRRAPLSVPCRWSRMGNEGGKPGGPGASRARDLANLLGLAADGAANPRQFANSAGLASETEADPAQFGRSHSKVLRKTRALRRVARERAQQASRLPLPHCPFATGSRADSGARRRGRRAARRRGTSRRRSSRGRHCPFSGSEAG